MFHTINFQNILANTNNVKTDKLNQEKAKLNILNGIFLTKNFRNTLGNTIKTKTDRLKHEKVELNNFFQNIL